MGVVALKAAALTFLLNRHRGVRIAARAALAARRRTLDLWAPKVWLVALRPCHFRRLVLPGQAIAVTPLEARSLLQQGWFTEVPSNGSVSVARFTVTTSKGFC